MDTDWIDELTWEEISGAVAPQTVSTHNEYNPDQPRDDHGRFGSGGTGSHGATTDTPQKVETKATSLVGRMVEKVKAKVGPAVKSALDGLNEESKGGVSLIAHGLKGSDPRAVAYGAAQIVGGIFRCVHEEIYENAISGHGGSAIAGKLVAKGLTAGEAAIGKALHHAMRKVGLVGNVLIINMDDTSYEFTANAFFLNQPLSAVDQALLEVGVDHTIEALTDLYDGAGLAGAVDIPSRDTVRARLLKVLAGTRQDEPVDNVREEDRLYHKFRSMME